MILTLITFHFHLATCAHSHTDTHKIEWALQRQVTWNLSLKWNQSCRRMSHITRNWYILPPTSLSLPLFKWVQMPYGQSVFISLKVMLIYFWLHFVFGLKWCGYTIHFVGWATLWRKKWKYVLKIVFLLPSDDTVQEVHGFQWNVSLGIFTKVYIPIFQLLLKSILLCITQFSG